MKLRLEIATNKRAHSWPWVLRELKKVPGHRVVKEDGLQVHVMEFDDPAALAAVFELVRSWKMVSVYQGKRRLSSHEAFSIYWKERSRDTAIDRLTESLNETALGNERKKFFPPPPPPGGDITLG